MEFLEHSLNWINRTFFYNLIDEHPMMIEARELLDEHTKPRRTTLHLCHWASEYRPSTFAILLNFCKLAVSKQKLRPIPNDGIKDSLPIAKLWPLAAVTIINSCQRTNFGQNSSLATIRKGSGQL